MFLCFMTQLNLAYTKKHITHICDYNTLLRSTLGNTLGNADPCGKTKLILTADKTHHDAGLYPH